MKSDRVRNFLRRQIRRRFLFASVTLIIYFSYALNYTEIGSFLNQRLGSSYISGSLLMYGLIIISSIGLEWIFLRTQEEMNSEGDEG